MEAVLNQNNSYDFACRICLQHNAELICLFDCRGSASVYEEVMFCTNVIIEKDDNFPHNICKECLSELDIATQFKRKSENSDTVLKQIYRRSLEKQIKVEFDAEISAEDDKKSSPFYSDTDEDCKPLKLLIKTKKKSVLSNRIKSVQNIQLDSENITNECEQAFENVEKKTERVSNAISESVSNAPETISETNETFEIVTKVVSEACGIRKTRRKKQKKHKKYLQKEEDYKCETCGLRCQSRWVLRVHLRTHSGERPFQCDVCLKRFVSNSNMRMHKRLTHDEEKQVCAACGKSFSCLTYLKRHQVTHLAVKPHGCALCPRRFSTGSYLREHEARHRGDRRFFCEACGARFISDVNLKQHMVVHGVHKWDFKRHQCTFCDYRTTGRVALARHVRKHTGEKPFLCPHEGCQSAFAGKASLNLHIRIHTGEKPYSCSECPAKFSRGDKFKNHMLKKHNINNVGPSKRSRLIIQELVGTELTDKLVELQ